MYISKATWFVFVCVLVIVTLSVTVFKNPSGSAQSGQENVRPGKQLSHEEMVRRYPTAEFEEPEAADSAKRATLKERKLRNNKHIFSEPSPDDGAIGWFPETVDLPALPINESDVILIGQVLSATAHRSENKRGIFSEFEVRVDEILKGHDPRLSKHAVIVVERTGGFLKYPNGRKVLFFVEGFGMPEVGARNVFFLKVAGQGFQIVTIYELGQEGVLPLDRGNKFQRFQGENEITFINTLRESIANARPQ